MVLQDQRQAGGGESRPNTVSERIRRVDPAKLGRLGRIPHRLLASVLRNWAGTITHVSSTEPVAALTFDDGPHPKFTPRLLEILEKHHARATFFMVGQAAKTHPELVRRVAQAGHAIGNHTQYHLSLPLISHRERLEQIRACAKVLAPYGQKLFRPPYGHQSVASHFDAVWLGYEVIAWNVVGLDWLDHKADWMAERMLSQIQPGSVVLLHDALYTRLEERYTDREPMLAAVAITLERLARRFRFVTVPELRRYGQIQREDWYREPKIDFLNRLTTEYGESRRYVASTVR